MKKYINVLLLLVSFVVSSQSEGQSFCAGIEDGSYFPLDVKMKKILWLDAFYYEEPIGSVKKHDKEYVEFTQHWKAGNIEHLLLREENGVVYQYEECCDAETVRFDNNFEKGHSWKTADAKTTYTIKSINGTLRTPYCEYDNLMVVEGKFTGVTFNFYYQKGYGYVGATESGNVISCVSPEWYEKK